MKRPRRGLLAAAAAAAAVLTLLGAALRSGAARDDAGDADVEVGLLTRAMVSVAEALGAREPAYAIGCYAETSAEPPADREEEEPKRGSIFFLETSCRSSRAGRLELGARQACAVESAARGNPGLQVYLLFASPAARNWTAWSWAARELLAYPNVHIRHVNVERYLRGTPLEELYTSGALRRSYWPVSHASDVLRFLTLWRYSGTYLDLDVVLTKPLDNMRNFAGAESPSNVAVGAINMADDELGRRVANECVHDIKESFRGDVWGHNGPGVMTRVLKRLCGVNKAVKMTPAKCGGFRVHPPSAFYPVSWSEWQLYFQEAGSDKTMARLRDSVAIHVWNKLSSKEGVRVGSRQPYGLIARRHCPRVYERSAPVF
ncbi:lactosylceramide 4-alpha-galactosyltransferase-like isoform X2 [Bacillus rossius redtenbacheri]|uniref:lactosylceramide 4-alpha-galactosyltransferase-like isoform X2 n=1 Tax=Bacillus rossius redtenbacheri TaxID=93214 RepID=UPI002FDD3816